MFPSSIATGGLSFGKIVSGISKTLNVANQMIPIYQQAKPLLSNAKGALGLLKAFNQSSDDKKETTPKEIVDIDMSDYQNTKKEPSSKNGSTISNSNQGITNNPVFFL